MRSRLRVWCCVLEIPLSQRDSLLHKYRQLPLSLASPYGQFYDDVLPLVHDHISSYLDERRFLQDFDEFLHNRRACS